MSGSDDLPRAVREGLTREDGWQLGGVNRRARHRCVARTLVSDPDGATWIVEVCRPTAAGAVADAVGFLVAPRLRRTRSDVRGWVVRVSRPESSWRGERVAHEEYVRWDALVGTTANAVVAALLAGLPLPG